MTQGKHTPGGMTNHWDGEGWASVGIGGYIRADMVGPVADRKANARRICAAWNACEGIPTEALEAGMVKDMLELHKKNARILGYLCDELQGIVEAGKLGALSKCCDRSLSAIARAIPAPAETRVQCYRGEYYKPKEHGTCIKRDGEVLWDTWEPET